MELKILSDSENESVGRREIRFSIMEDSSTPSKDAVKTELCKKLNIHPDSTAIVKISQAFGARQATGVAHSYPTFEAMRHYEHLHLFERDEKRKKKREAKAAGGEPEKKEDAKPEEKKE